MKLDGIHHITAITANAQQNVDFYAGTLGLRMVKKTVNQDQPSVYHLFYADEKGCPGADMTFFEFPDAAPGRAGAGDAAPDRVARCHLGVIGFLGSTPGVRRLEKTLTLCGLPTPRASSTNSWFRPSRTSR